MSHCFVDKGVELRMIRISLTSSLFSTTSKTDQQQSKKAATTQSNGLYIEGHKKDIN